MRLPHCVRSPAWRRRSPGGRAGCVQWVSEMQTTVMGCAGGGGEGGVRLREWSFAAITRRRWRGISICLRCLVAYFTVQKVLKWKIALTAEGVAHGRLTSQLHTMTLAEAMTPTPSEMQRTDSTGKGFRVKEIRITDKSKGVREC